MKNKPTANELRKLVAELKPRSPLEVMGSAASSSLMTSMFTAAFTGIGILLAATFLMFAVGLGPTNPSEKAQAADGKSTDTSSETSSADGNLTVEKSPTTPRVTADVQNDPDSGDLTEIDSTENAIQAMGIGESAAPDSKPIHSKTDSTRFWMGWSELKQPRTSSFWIRSMDGGLPDCLVPTVNRNPHAANDAKLDTHHTGTSIAATGILLVADNLR